jgi:hypothetical protein
VLPEQMHQRSCQVLWRMPPCLDSLPYIACADSSVEMSLIFSIHCWRLFLVFAYISRTPHWGWEILKKNFFFVLAREELMLAVAPARIISPFIAIRSRSM